MGFLVQEGLRGIGVNKVEKGEKVISLRLVSGHATIRSCTLLHTQLH